MSVSTKTKELIDRFIENITTYPQCDKHQLGEDIYSIVKWSLRNHLVGPMAQYKEDIIQDCALACWRKIAEGKIHYTDRRILGFFQLVTLNTMKTQVKRLSCRPNMLNSGELPFNLSTPFDFSPLLESNPDYITEHSSK